MNCIHVWVGWMWIRQLMLRWQDKDTVTSMWCQQRCLVQQTMDDTVILMSRDGRIDWMKFVKCVNKSTNMNCQQLFWLTIKALFLWEIFWHWFYYSFVKLKGVFFIRELNEPCIKVAIQDQRSSMDIFSPQLCCKSNYENQCINTRASNKV